MIELKLSQIAFAVDGVLIGEDVLVTGEVETDSRQVSAGALFVAKPGEVTDGHNFVESAFKSGAVAALVEKHQSNGDVPQVVVSNAVMALGKLAKFVLDQVRQQSDLKVIAITGSNGKTSTKNMLREILSANAETIAPIESFNNEVGAPISILRTQISTKYLVVELGAGGLGSIDYLAKIANADIGVVLKVGLAHVGEFGGIETTYQIKSELPRAMKAGAKLLLNADDSWVSQMSELTDAEVHWFGTSADDDVWGDDIEVSLKGTSFKLHIDEATKPVALNIIGEHHVMNALAALSVAHMLGLDIDRAIAALEAMKLAERWRMQLMPGINGSQIINDAYNASPESTKAALQTLATIGRQGHRTVAVLGEMAELGPQSATEHDSVGRLAVRLNIDQVVVVGDRAKLIHMGASQEGSWDGESKFFDSIDEALQYLRGLLGSGDVVLVKSSKSAELRFLGDALAEVNQ